MKSLSQRLIGHATGTGPGSQMTAEEWIEEAQRLMTEASTRIEPDDIETPCEACGECFNVDDMTAGTADDSLVYFCEGCAKENADADR